MKKIKIITILYITVFMVSGCVIKNDDDDVHVSFGVFSFFEGVSYNSNNRDTYIIKGVVLDEVGHGLRIKLIKDLKGNFPKTVNTFTVWGYDDRPFNNFLYRMDDLSLYDKQDTLIMHLTQILNLRQITPSVEKPGDYATLSHAYSVLTLSNGFVSHILTNSLLNNEEKEINTEPNIEPCICIDTTIFTPSIKIVSLTESDKAVIDKQLSKYTAFTLDIEELANYFHSNGGTGCARFQIDENFDWTIFLEYNDLRAPGYKQMYSNEYGTFEVTEPFVISTFKGETSNGKHVRASIYEKTLLIYANYDRDGNNFVIRNVRDYTRNREDETLIAYYTRHVIPIFLQDNMPWEDFQKELNELLNKK